jgi:DNA-binding SARP family transcriptional activator
VRLLGPVQATRAGGEVALGGPKQRAVLALLLLDAGRVVPADRLVEEVWRGSAPPGAAKTLRSYVSRLRTLLGPDAELVARGGGYAVTIPSDQVDASRFERLVAAGQRALGLGEAAAAAGHFREALALWRGRALADVAEVQALALEGARLEELRLVATEGHIEADLELGRAAEVTGELERLVAEHPLRERLWRLLVLALYRAERQADALAAYRRARSVLTEELGLEPGEELRRLEEAVLRHEVPPPTTAAVMRALPRDIAGFAGRDAELGQLLGNLASAAAGGGVVGIYAIGGMAGIGKTTLAVHAAHRLAERFPDGQLFLPLHAHTPGQRPVDPADALASLLLAAGIGAQQIPPGLTARASRWRDYLAGKSILLVLDDAAGHEQVRPLLPGTAGSLVLVTSRRRLAALEDAAVISLDALAPGEAAELLARLADRPGEAAGDPGVGEIARLCGYLPLAIGMLARQLHHHPAWTTAGLAVDLAAAQDRLALMRAEDLSVAAAFDLSYQDLPDDQQRLFRRLGLHPGPSIDAYAAAALDDISPDRARHGLEGLYDQHLLIELAPGRYRLHDLLREHARALADADDPADCAAAGDRLLDYYAGTALAASTHIATRMVVASPPSPSRPPPNSPLVATPGQAAAWMHAERANLHAAAGYAAAARPQQAIALSAAMAGFLDAQGHWDQAAALHQAAATAARQIGDRAGQARALSDLSAMQGQTGDYRAASASVSRALSLYRELGDRAGQACALNQLGFLQHFTGSLPAAAATHRQALTMFRDLGHRHGQGNALNQLGTIEMLTGDYPAAAASCQQALELFRDLGQRLSEGDALYNLAIVHLLTGDYPAAGAAQRQALELFGDLGDRYGEAHIVSEMGSVQRLTGDYEAAAASQRQALELFRDLGDRDDQAWVLNELGLVQQLTGDYEAAAASHQQALDMFRESSTRPGQAAALNSLGELLSRSSASQRARDHHTQALAIARDLGVPQEEARALEGLGRCDIQDGHPGDGARKLRQALVIYQRIGAPDAGRVQESLRGHG